MNHIAWLTCAFLSIAAARIVERCELAHDLQALGVPSKQISTWVCIAQHESNYDTNATNVMTRDHGIFQISEEYWCGTGKGCGLPCSAFQDDDITNDIECALLIYNNFQKLKGNGFSAWTTYHMYCSGNTEDYLMDCDL